ncbi:FAD-binding oxidoreductase [Williamsia sterculiae]|uniref:nitric oxide dioxygenase n=1 Tax=Williamsia sterculiae TaxID=1344003 RepID=A0A1N7CJW4_9NOCA|nr:FAD-binding oxidoreductase [Williamsia sterculiae]SIR63869.1 NAD(P)H-flavin reductase [Williamsia sterculiae]
MGTHTRHPLLDVRDAMNGDTDRFTTEFYARLFGAHPELRDLFPAELTTQKAALLSVLDHVLATVPDAATHEQLVQVLAQLGRDHRKYGVEERHYGWFFEALMRQFAATMGREWDDEYSAVTTQAMMLTTGVMRGAAQSTTDPPMWQARVVEKFRISRDIAVIRLLADQPLRYRAGQYLEVQIPQWPRLWRDLSPALPPNPDGQLEFHVRSVPRGTVSQSMVTETAVGDVWALAQSHGTLHVDTDRPVLMLAGGTGLAPLRALLLQMARRADAPSTHVFYGARSPGELYELPMLRQLTATNPWLRVVGVVESDEDPWWLRTSNDPAALGVDVVNGTVVGAALAAGDWSGHQVLVAGPPEMIDVTRERLLRAGVPEDLIRHDPV